MRALALLLLSLLILAGCVEPPRRVIRHLRPPVEAIKPGAVLPARSPEDEQRGLAYVECRKTKSIDRCLTEAAKSLPSYRPTRSICTGC
jgi:hypothetical protein